MSTVPRAATVTSLNLAGPMLIALLAAASCTTAPVKSEYDPNATFLGYHTFSLMDRQHSPTGDLIALRLAQEAIRSDLIFRGYSQAADPVAADFVVDVTVGSQDRTEIDSYPAAYGIEWPSTTAWWGRRYWGSDIDSREYGSRVLSIDVFDQASRRAVWHGWARTPLPQERDDADAHAVTKSVAVILSWFPPGHPRP